MSGQSQRLMDDDATAKRKAQVSKTYREDCLCASTIVIGVVALVALGFALAAFFKSDSVPKKLDQTRHIYCVDAHDRTGDDVSTGLLGKATLNTKNNSLCVDLLWVRDTGDCGQLDSIDVMGGLNETLLLDGLLVGNLYTGPNTNVSETLKACFHVSPKQAVKILRNPAFYYIEGVFSGGGCVNRSYRDYFTSSCQDADFVLRNVDDDDDDVDVISSDEEEETSEQSSSSSSSSIVVRKAQAAHKAAAAAAAHKALAHHKHGRN